MSLLHQPGKKKKNVLLLCCPCRVFPSCFVASSKRTHFRYVQKWFCSFCNRVHTPLSWRLFFLKLILYHEDFKQLQSNIIFLFYITVHHHYIQSEHKETLKGSLSVSLSLSKTMIYHLSLEFKSYCITPVWDISYVHSKLCHYVPCSTSINHKKSKLLHYEYKDNYF